jgi:hypothetical protein
MANNSAGMFAPVQDDEVFLTRIKEREENESMRKYYSLVPIYEKPTATTRAPLKRVKEGEI